MPACDTPPTQHSFTFSLRALLLAVAIVSFCSASIRGFGGPIASVGLFLFCFWLAVDRLSLRVRKVLLLIATLLAYPWAVYSCDDYLLESGRTQWRFDWMPWWFPYIPAAENLTTIPIQIIAPSDWDEIVNYQGEGVVTVNPHHAGRLWGYMAVMLAVSVAFENARRKRRVNSSEIPRRRIA